MEELTPLEQSEAKNTTFSVAPEDNAQLHALVNQALGIKEELAPNPKDELPDPTSIHPISTDQIKIMRKFASTKVVHRNSLRKIVYEAIIRSFFELIDFFKPDARAKRCMKEGHECIHCGQKIMVTPPPPENENNSSEST